MTKLQIENVLNERLLTPNEKKELNGIYRPFNSDKVKKGFLLDVLQRSEGSRNQRNKARRYFNENVKNNKY